MASYISGDDLLGKGFSHTIVGKFLKKAGKNVSTAVAQLDPTSSKAAIGGAIRTGIGAVGNLIGIPSSATQGALIGAGKITASIKSSQKKKSATPTQAEAASGIPTVSTEPNVPKTTNNMPLILGGVAVGIVLLVLATRK